MGINFYHYRRTKEQNKILIEKYPWLCPYVEDFDYSCTLLDAMPDGWNYTFGEQMCEEILEALKLDNIPVEQYKVLQVKEKYGSLRWYDNGGKHVDEVLRKYENISEQICCRCGKPATHYSTGWILYWCKDCIEGDHSDNYKPLK